MWEKQNGIATGKGGWFSLETTFRSVGSWSAWGPHYHGTPTCSETLLKRSQCPQGPPGSRTPRAVHHRLWHLTEKGILFATKRLCSRKTYILR